VIDTLTKKEVHNYYDLIDVFNLASLNSMTLLQTNNSTVTPQLIILGPGEEEGKVLYSKS
jgi:hypothetical protein